jgi:CDGSH-type Zn-finger protein
MGERPVMVAPLVPGTRHKAFQAFRAFPIPEIVDSKKADPMSEISASEALVAQKAPFTVDVESGKKYWWCACGRSAKQPFCDGSHKGTDFTPLEYEADEDGTLNFCGCKASNRKPLCDGTHNKI